MRLLASILVAISLAGHAACSRGTQYESADTAAGTNSNQWEPSQTIAGGFRRDLVGNSRQHGPFKYQLKIPAGTRLAPHWHSVDVHVQVMSGSMSIIMGELLETSRAQRFPAGSIFVVPANTLHEEWFDEDTVVQGEGVGPMETVYKGR